MTFISLLMSTFVCLGQDETEIFTFTDSFESASSGTLTNVPLLSKSERVTKNDGLIEITAIGEIPDSIVTCANVAANIWESVIKNKSKIHFQLKYEDIGNEATKTEVVYNTDKGKYVPSSLYYQTYPENENPCYATLIVNSKMNWICDHSSQVFEGRGNLTYSLLRAIGVTLGFGSSLQLKTTGNSTYIGANSGKYYSLFDRLIKDSDQKALSSVRLIGNRYNAALSDFAQPKNGRRIYALKTDSEHLLYAPEAFDDGKSLVYLDNPNSLMHYQLEKGHSKLQIDDTTIELLKEIGWELDRTKDIEIVSNDLPDTGIGSAYTSHSFTIRNNSGTPIENRRWEFIAPLKTGGDRVVSSADGTTGFTIPAIGDSEEYAVNVNGDIRATVKFQGTVNGIAVKDSYSLSLELKPSINHVTIISREFTPEMSSYRLNLAVEYSGSDRISLAVEVEGNPVTYENEYHYPFIAHLTTKYISIDYYAWVDLIVRNEYGETIYTIDLEPLIGLDENKNQTSVKTIDISENDIFEAVDFTGRIAASGEMNELNKTLNPGFYIFKSKSNPSVTFKKVIR